MRRSYREHQEAVKLKYTDVHFWINLDQIICRADCVLLFKALIILIFLLFII